MLEHQQSVEKLVQLIETLLDTSGDTHPPDEQNSDRTGGDVSDRTLEEE